MKRILLICFFIFYGLGTYAQENTPNESIDSSSFHHNPIDSTYHNAGIEEEEPEVDSSSFANLFVFAGLSSGGFIAPNNEFRTWLSDNGVKVNQTVFPANRFNLLVGKKSFFGGLELAFYRNFNKTPTPKKLNFGLGAGTNIETKIVDIVILGTIGYTNTATKFYNKVPDDLYQNAKIKPDSFSLVSSGAYFSPSVKFIRKTSQNSKLVYGLEIGANINLYQTNWKWGAYYSNTNNGTNSGQFIGWDVYDVPKLSKSEFYVSLFIGLMKK